MPERLIDILITLLILVLLGVFGKQISQLGTRKLVLLAMMASLSVAGSVALVTFPGLQPSSFLIILSAISMGPGAGILCGVATALLARLLGGGLGPWAIWQAALWALMGLLAGLLRKRGMVVHGCIGFVWGFAFGWIMNLQWYTMMGQFSFPAYLLACGASFSADLTHALCNAVLLICFGKQFLKLFERFGGEKNGAIT
jgi:energy-coupling factor transport system substrate-specific component